MDATPAALGAMSGFLASTARAAFWRPPSPRFSWSHGPSRCIRGCACPPAGRPPAGFASRASGAGRIRGAVTVVARKLPCRAGPESRSWRRAPRGWHPSRHALGPVNMYVEKHAGPSVAPGKSRTRAPPGIRWQRAWKWRRFCRLRSRPRASRAVTIPKPLRVGRSQFTVDYAAPQPSDQRSAFADRIDAQPSGSVDERGGGRRKACRSARAPP